jgi:hypothetical protein
VIDGDAENYLLVAEPNTDPFNIVNENGENILYYSVNQGVNGSEGALRAGNFRESDLQNIGNYSAAFGFHTTATGPGSLVHGIDNSPTSILAAGAGSEAFGIVGDEEDNTGSIISNEIGSVTHGYAVGGVITAEENSIGSNVHGYANGAAEILSSGYGTNVNGYANGTALIEAGTLSHGSNVFGYANGFFNGSGTISTAVNSYGSTVHGNADGISGGTGTISTSSGSTGANIHGNASGTLGGTARIDTGTSTTGVTIYGNANASTDGSAILSCGDLCSGVQIHGRAEGENTLTGEITSGRSVYGSTAAGYARDGTIRINDSANGSMAIGIAETNEEHRVDTEGAFAFGRNNLVQGVTFNPGTENEFTTEPIYSGTIGQESHAHMRGSFAHSSFARLTSVKGDCQYVRVLTRGTATTNASAEMTTGDGHRLTFPFENIQDGRAIVNANIVGDTDACVKIVFCVTLTGGTYTVTSASTVHSEGINGVNPIGNVNGFTVELTPFTLPQNFCGTFKITMMTTVQE